MTGWLDSPLLVVDCETDGQNPLDAELLQVCVGYSAGPGDWQPRTWLLKPSRPISPESTAVHGITTEYVEEHGQDRKQALREIDAELFETHDFDAFVIHNAIYDTTVLSRALEMPFLSEWYAVLDTLVLFRRFDRETGSKSLTALAAKHGIVFPAHDAEADSLATLRLLHILAGQVELLPHVPVETLHDLQRGWYAQQQEQIVARAKGEGRDIPLVTDWPVLTP